MKRSSLIGDNVSVELTKVRIELGRTYDPSYFRQVTFFNIFTFGSGLQSKKATLESGQPAVEAGGQDLMESKMMYLEVTLFSSLSETGAR